MSTPPRGNNTGQGSAHAEEADSLDLNGRQAMKGRERPQAIGSPGRIAESQRAIAEGQAAIDPLVADQALTSAEQKRDNGPKLPSEPRSTADPAFANTQALNGIDRRLEGLQALTAGALGATAAREAARSDVSELAGFVDKTLQGRAAAVMGETADQHPVYRTALKEASTQYAGLAERAYADEQQRSAAKEDREALEYASRRDDAADSIAGRYATMASAGLTVKDLQGPALDRLAVKDGRDLLLIEGFPPHPRASEARALVADSLKIEAYRTIYDREAAEWTTPSVGRRAIASSRGPSSEGPDQATAASAGSLAAKQSSKTAPSAERTDINSMRSEGDTAEKRRAIPPLEDRFNVRRVGLIEKDYHFRDQAGKVAFTDRFRSISTSSESPATIKAMVDRAAERGWQTVRLEGSREFVRQGWIAAAAQGIRAVGHTPTPADREAAAKERERLQVSQDTGALRQSAAGIVQDQPSQFDRTRSDRPGSEVGGQRKLAAAIEKALADGKVSPELRGRVRAMMTAEGARRAAKGDRVNVPVYDSRAPRARSKTVQTVPQRQANREQSR
jgi:hypothetical protein